MRKLTLAIAFAAVSALMAVADNWPAWRGLDGNGICHEAQVPLHWSTNENVRWHVPLPDRGNSTPIVWSNHVFVTQAIEKEKRRTLMCFDRRDGKLLWERGPIWTDKELTHPDNPPCTPSPVTDGERVIAWFGSAGMYCFDFDGRELWRRDLGPQKHEWGYASSPVLYRDLCFLNFGPGKRSFVIALDKKTGAAIWQRDAPTLGPNAKWEDFGGQTISNQPASQSVSEIAGSWATPLVVPSAGQDELVVAFALRLMAFAPTTGEPLWTCDGPNIGGYSSPFFGEGIVALNASGTTNTITAVRPGGRGDVTKTHRIWLQLAGNNKTCLGAGVIYRGHIYQVNMMGFLECRALTTGQLLWEERLTGTGAQCVLVRARAGGRPALCRQPQRRRVRAPRQSEIRMPGYQLDWRRADERVAGHFGQEHFHSHGQTTVVYRQRAEITPVIHPAESGKTRLSTFSFSSFRSAAGIRLAFAATNFGR